MSTLTVERAEQLIRSLTEGLVNIKDETGEFLMTSEQTSKIAYTPDWDKMLISRSFVIRLQFPMVRSLTRKAGKDGNGRTGSP